MYYMFFIHNFISFPLTLFFLLQIRAGQGLDEIAFGRDSTFQKSE